MPVPLLTRHAEGAAGAECTGSDRGRMIHRSLYADYLDRRRISSLIVSLLAPLYTLIHGWRPRSWSW
jgi:hypothetical protein